MRILKRSLLALGLLVILVPVLLLSFVILSIVSPSAVIWGVVCMVLLGVWLLFRRRGSDGSLAGRDVGSNSRSKEGLL